MLSGGDTQGMDEDDATTGTGSSAESTEARARTLSQSVQRYRTASLHGIGEGGAGHQCGGGRGHQQFFHLLSPVLERNVRK